MPAPGFEHGGKEFLEELIVGFAVVFIFWNIVGGIFPFARLLAVLYIIVSIFNIASKAKYWNTRYMLGFVFIGLLSMFLLSQLISLDIILILAIVFCYLVNRFV